MQLLPVTVRIVRTDDLSFARGLVVGVVLSIPLDLAVAGLMHALGLLP